jgi:hypothetical protein
MSDGCVDATFKRRDKMVLKKHSLPVWKNSAVFMYTMSGLM